MPLESRHELHHISLAENPEPHLRFETADSFPPGHPYARTRWEAAYFDIASDVKPDEIERRICAAIANTPSVFAYITNPTPRMQRALLNVIHDRLRRQPAQAPRTWSCY